MQCSDQAVFVYACRFQLNCLVAFTYMRRCSVCFHKKPHQYIVYAGRHGRRCRACYTARRERVKCQSCGMKTVCETLNTAQCSDCQIDDMLQNGCLPPKPVHPSTSASSLHFGYVALWIRRIHRWCELLGYRIILWQLFGLVAGVPRGPPTNVFVRRHGIGSVNTRLTAQYLDSLWATSRWPRGGAPLLLIGVRCAELSTIKLRLRRLPMRQAHRLTSVNDTLSEWMATVGFRGLDSICALHQCLASL